jgi:DNA-binding CsgD family transcriptional regulator/PAS domain-containing protein
VQDLGASVTTLGRRPAESELLSLRFVLDRSSDAFVGHDMLGRRIYSNEVYDRLVGCENAAFLGKWGPFPEWDVATEAAIGAGVRQARTAFRHGAEITTPLVVTMRHASGQTATVKMFLHLVTDSSQEPVAVIAMTQPAHRVPWLERRSGNDVERVRVLESAIRVIALELSRIGIAPVEGARSVDGTNPDQLESLSARQWEVFQQILAGRRVTSIASSMHLSEHTVRNHLKAIFIKLGVSSQCELVERFRAVRASPPERPKQLTALTPGQ